jgi:hypothetical protein
MGCYPVAVVTLHLNYEGMSWRNLREKTISKTLARWQDNIKMVI